jgi:cytochrome c5
VAAGGQALVEQKCTMCHPIDQVNNAKYDQAGWEALVARMVQNGLVVTPEERQAILDYLVQRDAGN